MSALPDTLFPSADDQAMDIFVIFPSGQRRENAVGDDFSKLPTQVNHRQNCAARQVVSSFPVNEETGGDAMSSMCHPALSVVRSAATVIVRPVHAVDHGGAG
jgi:hypothetical protein